ncbi:bifunctional metallophosphatase/5'-nucleotidase [Ferrimonas sp. YFM]|uniref:bifunctional metallophosphatase/5'-nucleotidase n=1 Tax=Ferrimonas sp. YFM TaxID=3028878 RepID=UPI0025739DA9|nr:bifunctional metallophosphatase/5'-nucleotidase [Ferrimonas sp. YFM]BDY03621.1 bifunctional metallophosphatase/5'-nucleotidase [Ferrimonas sp. YFM]
MMKLQKSLIAVSLLAALSACSDSDNDNGPSYTTPDNFSLIVAHINDTHSNFDATSLDFTAHIEHDSDHDGLDEFSVRSDVGGYPRIAAKLAEARYQAGQANTPFLALHGGDAFQGSLYFNQLQGKGNARLLSDMGLDAMAVGNHEFDLGNAALIDFVNNVNFPVLAANMDTSKDSDMSKLDNLKPYIIKEFDGIAVGVFGLVLEDMPTISSPGEDLVFEKEVASAQATVDELKKKGVEQIIMVSHIGVDRDMKVAENVNGIDLIVGGHSHTLLGDFTNIGLGHGDAEVDYAQIVTNPDGLGKTCVVQAGQYAQAVGQVKVDFAKGAVSNCGGHNTLLIDNNFAHKYDGKNRIALTDEHQGAVESFVGEQDNIAISPEDPLMRLMIDTEYAPEVEKLKAKVVGQVNDANDPVDSKSLDHTRIPGQAKFAASLPTTGSEAGAHVAASMVWKLNKHGYNIDMAITNTGGVRDNIAAGENGLTAGYIIGSLLYFNNELAIVELKGKDVRDLLDSTINYSITTSSGAFPTTANVQYTFNGKATAGEQIEGLQVCPGGVAANSCVDIEDEKVYKIATNAYIAGGKDGYAIFAERNQAPMVKSGFIDNESMIEYVEMMEANGEQLVQLPTGLTFIAPDGLKQDDPVKKAGD